MEILKRKLQNSQSELEEALRMEINYDEVKETKEGKKLLKYVRKRRHIVNGISKILDKI